MSNDTVTDPDIEYNTTIRTVSGESRGEGDKRILLLPYVILTLVLLGMACASFLHFHIRNRGKYSTKKKQERNEQQQFKRKYRVTLNRFAFLSNDKKRQDDRGDNGAVPRVQSSCISGGANKVPVSIEMSTITPNGLLTAPISSPNAQRDNFQEFNQSKYLPFSNYSIQNHTQDSNYEYCDSEKSLISDPGAPCGKRVTFSIDMPMETSAMEMNSRQNIFDNPAFDYVNMDGTSPAERPHFLDLSASKPNPSKSSAENGLPHTRRKSSSTSEPSTSSPDQLSPVTSERLSQIPNLHSPEFRRDNRLNQGTHPPASSLSVPANSHSIHLLIFLYLSLRSSLILMLRSTTNQKQPEQKNK